MSVPYYFDTINQTDSHLIPGTIKPGDNALGMYYRRYLFQRAFSIYDFTGAPEGWDLEYLKSVLLCWGYCAVIRTDRWGVIPQQCGISGYNVYYRPTRALITNPLFDRTYDLKIGEETELIRLSPDWRGIADLIGRYADLLALVTTSIVTNLYNSRLSYVFGADEKAVAESFKLMFDKVTAGNPAVFVHKNLFNDEGEPRWTTFAQDLKGTYIIDLLQGAERCIMSQFYGEIGIPNIPYEKNERLNMAESSVNDYATQCLVDLWKRTINSSLDKVNRMFDLNVRCVYNETLEEVMDNVRSDLSLGNGAVQSGERANRDTDAV